MDKYNIISLITAYEKGQKTLCMNCKSAFECPATSSHCDECNYQIYTSTPVINVQNYNTYKKYELKEDNESEVEKN